LPPVHEYSIKLAWFWKQTQREQQPGESRTKADWVNDKISTELRNKESSRISRTPPILIMSQATPAPALSPQFCFNTRLLRDFLRLSRSTIDDSITNNLNALLTPSTSSPFSPNSTSVRAPPTSLRRQPIPSSSCSTFKDRVLFPTWSARTDVLTYCSHVATSPDPDDPELPSIQEQNKRGAERVVNERLDPYSGRFFPREPRTEQLAQLLRNENAVENIIRTRTWNSITERCEGVEETRWEDALDGWRKRQG